MAVVVIMFVMVVNCECVVCVDVCCAGYQKHFGVVAGSSACDNAGQTGIAIDNTSTLQILLIEISIQAATLLQMLVFCFSLLWFSLLCCWSVGLKSVADRSHTADSICSERF